MQPPQVEPLQAPETTKESPVLFLKSLGITPVIPKIRSSDFHLVREDPFLYFLTRRLGLSPVLRYSEALSRGSWFHVCLEILFRNPSDHAALKRAFDAILQIRLTELKTLCTKLNMGPSHIANILEVETQDAKTSLGWFLASLQYANPNFPGLSQPWPKKLLSGDLIWLASELDIEIPISSSPKAPLIIRLDALLYNKKTNTLWIFDPKTTGKAAWFRAQTCPLEDQTFHYLYVLHHYLTTTTHLHEKYNLPADVKLGGMIHFCLTKPSIRFGMSDRQWWLVSESKRSNIRAVANPTKKNLTALKRDWTIICTAVDPSKPSEPYRATHNLSHEEAIEFLRSKSGIKTVEKEYTGEPSYDIYTDRCIDFYNGTGDHADLREAHMGKDAKTLPMNFSYTAAAPLLGNSRRESEYLHWLSLVKKYATCPINLENFPRTIEGMVSRDGLTEFAPFYTAPLRDWSRIMRENLIIQSHRDPIPS